MSAIPRPMFRSFKEIGRSWFKRTWPTQLTKKPTFEFTVASYNVLADRLLQDHPHLYYTRRQETWIFDWNYRKKNLLAEIAHSNADILCLQEVQEEHYYDWFSPQLKEYGYTGVYNKRSGDKQDGCATFFKHALFCMEHHQLVSFNKPHSQFMNRDNVAILVILTPRAENLKNASPIVIGNTHLLFNMKRGDIKLAQLAHLFAEIDRLAIDSKRKTKLPTILCGDLNSTPFSPLYNFVTTGELDFRGMTKVKVSGQDQSHDSYNKFRFQDRVFPSELNLTHTCKWMDSTGERTRNSNFKEEIDLTHENKPQLQIDLTGSYEDTPIRELNEEPGFLRHDLDFRSSYMHHGLDGSREVTTCHDRACSTVDYILYSPGYKRYPKHPDDEQLWLSGVLSLLSEFDIQRLGKLPNQNISSDHLMLMSSFVLS